MTSNSDSYILFELAETTYALPATHVQHIEMLEHVTPVPNAAPFIAGVVFSRGQVVPAIDLRGRFGLPRQPSTPRTRLIVVRLEERLAGLIVDQAREFRTIPESTIAPAQPAVARASGNWLTATATVAERLVLLPCLRTILELPAGSDQRPIDRASIQPHSHSSHA
jgi:purine-binding chemotaxis protein CheW